MNNNKINFTNFHHGTQATFSACEKINRTPDFKSDSGSEYWDTGNSVVRKSDHWTGIHNGSGYAAVNCINTCKWALKNNAPFELKEETKDKKIIDVEIYAKNADASVKFVKENIAKYDFVIDEENLKVTSKIQKINFKILKNGEMKIQTIVISKHKKTFEQKIISETYAFCSYEDFKKR